MKVEVQRTVVREALAAGPLTGHLAVMGPRVTGSPHLGRDIQLEVLLNCQ